MRLSIDSWKNTLAKFGFRRVRRPEDRAKPRGSLTARSRCSPSNPYAIQVTVIDDDTGTVSDGTTVEVTNVAPVIVELSNSSPGCGGAEFGETITIGGTFADVGTLDTHAASVHWGDGTESDAVVTEANGSGSISASHIYTDGGVYTITVTLTDDDTGVATETSTTVIAGVGLNDGQLQIVGTPGRDIVDIKLYTGGGDDRIFGGDGKDKLWGGPGNDLLDGGGGNDDKVKDDKGNEIVDLIYDLP